MHQRNVFFPHDLWTEDKVTFMSHEAVKSVLITKVSFAMSYLELRHQIKENNKLLKRVYSNDKYRWFQKQQQAATAATSMWKETYKLL